MAAHVRRCLRVLSILPFAALGLAQTPTAATQIANLQAQVQQLGSTLKAVESQLAETQAALAQLQARLGGSGNAPATPAEPAERVQQLEDQQAVTSGDIATQEQTKVASGSRFHLTLSGLMLFNMYGDQGTMDNADVPNFAFGSQAPFTAGSVGASVRQSEISLLAEGPQLWGAQASGELIADFFGGLPNYLDGSASGIARVKIARGRLDWQNTSVQFGLDKPLISPLSPTSYASVAIPPLGYSGNLWTYTPQLAVEQRWRMGEWSDTLQAGVMDPLSGQFPASTSFRAPEAGELARTPAFEVHEGVGRTIFGRQAQAGVGGYASRQNYGFGRIVNAWAVTGDWTTPVTSWLAVSGEVYRGRAIGGLWAASGNSIASSSSVLTNPATQIAGLNAAGGWAQLKFTASPTLEFNTAYGADNAFAGDLRRFDDNYTTYPLAQNRTWFANAIEKPRSDLVFALEYRRLHTARLDSTALAAAQINAAIGVIF